MSRSDFRTVLVAAIVAGLLGGALVQLASTGVQTALAQEPGPTPPADDDDGDDGDDPATDREAPAGPDYRIAAWAHSGAPGYSGPTNGAYVIDGRDGTLYQIEGATVRKIGTLNKMAGGD